MDTEVINEEVEPENSYRMTKEETSFIKKNLKVYNAYEKKFVKPRSLA